MGFTNPISSVQAIIAGTVDVQPVPGASIAIAGTPTVDIAGTPTVDIGPGATVNITGATTGTAPPAGTPSFTNRVVSAASAASASFGGGSGATTLVTGPTSPAKLELHQAVVSVSDSNSSPSAVSISADIEDSTGVVLLTVNLVIAGAGGGVSAGNNSAAIDFQGATLPAGRGLKLRLAVGGLSGNATASITYTTVT